MLSHIVDRIIQYIQNLWCAIPGRVGTQRLRRLQQVLASLPGAGREIFLLHRVEGLPIPMIAARLAMTAEEVEAELVGVLLHVSTRLELD